jgi:hypothetical protein
MWVLKRKFCFFSTSVEMYHTSTILWWPVATHFSASVSPLTSRFLLTMAISGFGPYHCLWPNDAPAKCTGITPTPWAMIPMLGFVSYDRGHELLVPPPQQRICRFCFLGCCCQRVVILIVINICFSSFNGVDLSHIMLVDCCMLCCRESGPIAAV